MNLISGFAKTSNTLEAGPISIAAGSEFRMGYDPNINGTDEIKIAREYTAGN